MAALHDQVFLVCSKVLRRDRYKDILACAHPDHIIDGVGKPEVDAGFVNNPHDPAKIPQNSRFTMIYDQGTGQRRTIQ